MQPSLDQYSMAAGNNGNIGRIMPSQSDNNINTNNINSANNNNNMQEPMPAFDSFAWLVIGISVAIVFGSAYFYKKSKQELGKTIEMLDT